MELSGRPFQDVHAVAEELDRHLEIGRAIGADLGVEFLAAGYRPWGTPATARWVPKERYAVMRPFLAARGRLAPDMMSMTGSAQASFDFASERDAGEKLRVALGAQPAIVALCANSPVVRGAPSGWQSYRTEVWNHTDPARCGVLPFAFEAGFEEDAYRRYVEWVLDVPMVFLRRDGRYLDPGGIPFRRFLAEGLAGHHATLADWEDQLSVVFPEVRMKGVIEVRGADGVPPPMVKALAAFWKGILYSRESRDWAWDLVRRYPLADRVALRDAAGREGLRARTPDGRTLAALAVRPGRGGQARALPPGRVRPAGRGRTDLARALRRAGRGGPLPGRRRPRGLRSGRGRRAGGAAAHRRVAGEPPTLPFAAHRGCVGRWAP